MLIPRSFQFSQGSLQDYVDCRRRFQLLHLQRRAWPAVEVEPVLENERYMKQGTWFHRLIQQNLLGIPAGRLSVLARDEHLGGWWQNYLDHRPDIHCLDEPDMIGATRRPELNLVAPLAGFNLVAKCDLIVTVPGRRAVIFDWKTSRKRPPRNWLAARLQTRVYPYLLVRAGAHLNAGLPFRPEQVEMLYWFAGFPDRPERFPYSPEQYRADDAYLTGLVAEAACLQEVDFYLTPLLERCKYCVYRSLCGRGTQAGVSDEDGAGLEQEQAGDLASEELAFDFDQIAEIEF